MLFTGLLPLADQATYAAKAYLLQRSTAQSMVGPPTLISKITHRHVTDQCDRGNSSTDVPAAWADLELCQVDKPRKPVNLESSTAGIVSLSQNYCRTTVP